MLGDFAMPRGVLELVDDLAIPFQAKPVEPINDGVDCALRGPLAVGVLDPQQHLASAPTRVEPIEQRGARASDMKKAGRRWRKAGDDLRHKTKLADQAWEDRGGSGATARLVVA